MRPHIPTALLPPLLLGATVLCLYALTVSCAHSGDDIQAIMPAEVDATGAPIIHPISTALDPDAPTRTSRLQPRYMLVVPTETLLYDAARRLGWAQSAVRPVQLAHALLGAFGIVCFYLALQQGVPEPWSLAASAGLSSSYAWWFYSTHLDYPIAAHALTCLFLYLLFGMIRPGTRHWTARRGVALGIVNALAILYLVTRVVLVPVAAITLFAAARNDRGMQPRSLPRPAAGYAVGLVLALALFTALLALREAWSTGSPPTLSGIEDALAYRDSFVHSVTLLDAPKALYGFAKSLVVYPGTGDREPRELLASTGVLARTGLLAWYTVMTVAAAVPLALMVFRWRALTAWRIQLLALASWFVLELPFVVYWEPTYVKWLVGMLIPWWGIVAILAAGACAEQPERRPLLAGAAITAVALLFAVNLLTAFLPAVSCGANAWLRTTSALAAMTTPADLFVAAESRPLDFYLPYFGRRRTVSFGLMRLRGDDESAALVALRSLIDWTSAHGGRVYVYPCNEPYLGRVGQLVAPDSWSLEPIALEGAPARDFTVCRAVERDHAPAVSR